MNYNFGEKQFETYQGKTYPVWQSPKYLESKAKAIEILDSGKYGVAPSDFWILMNTTKTEKMAYTGLIISHNGCLKINDALPSKFDPSCVSVDKDGYKGSLVYTYINPDQGIYEIGEVAEKNCKNAYPYAMAYKRLFDRVVLKLSKLAYSGILSDSEADEFKDPLDAAAQPAPAVSQLVPCTDCGETILPVTHNKKTYSVEEIVNQTTTKYGAPLCWDCSRKRKEMTNA